MHEEIRFCYHLGNIEYLLFEYPVAFMLACVFWICQQTKISCFPRQNMNTSIYVYYTTPMSIEGCSFTSIGIPMLKMRRPRDRLIFNMGIHYMGKTVFLLKQGPGQYCFRLELHEYIWGVVSWYRTRENKRPVCIARLKTICHSAMGSWNPSMTYQQKYGQLKIYLKCPWYICVWD